MLTRRQWSRGLLVAGLVAMVLGAIDPLEGSVVILAGGGLAALGARLGGGPTRDALYAAFALLILGVGALWGLSAAGGIGGDGGRSIWWGVVLLPYPVGFALGIASAVRALRPPRGPHPTATA